MENNEIRVTISTENDRAEKLENILKGLAKTHSKAMKNDRVRYIDNDSWDEYNSLSDEDINDLLTRKVINTGWKSVQMLKEHKADKCDYIFINNIDYVRDNFPHVVADAWARIKTQYQAKYPTEVWHGVRCAILNAINHCKNDDHDSKTTALFKVNNDGEEYCVVDTENERARDYEVDTEEKAIFNASLHSMPYELQCIAYDEMYGDYTREQMARRIYHYWNARNDSISGQMVSKKFKSMRKYF